MFAGFETNLPKERQLEGIAKAKAEGAYRGEVAQQPAMPIVFRTPLTRASPNAAGRTDVSS